MLDGPACDGQSVFVRDWGVEMVEQAAVGGTRDQILQTALELFRVQGFDGTSLRQISDKLGLTKAAVYYHFPAKEHLVVELTRPILDGLADVVAAARRGVPAVEDILGRYLDLLLAEHEVASLLWQDPGAMSFPEVGGRAAALLSALQGALVGPDATDADHIRVWCALGAINGTAALPSARVEGARGHVLAAALAALRSG